jgi:hypothetical protein
MTQELDGGGGEHALLPVDDQARLAQPRENFSQMIQMLLLVSAGYDDVVQVAEDEGEARQDAVHHPLEGVARVAQPERHAAKLEQPKRRADGGFPDVSWVHGYLIITLP